MTEERRAHVRVLLNLPARYDGLSGVNEARLEDISMGGCFVNTHGEVILGEVITVGIQMPSGEWLQLRGKVATYQPSIGFGVAFGTLTDEEALSLRNLITTEPSSDSNRLGREHAFADEEQTMSDQVAVVRIFSTEMEATMAQQVLEQSGVTAFVLADDAGGMEPHLQRTSGVRW